VNDSCHGGQIYSTTSVIKSFGKNGKSPSWSPNPHRLLQLTTMARFNTFFGILMLAIPLLSVQASTLKARWGLSTPLSLNRRWFFPSANDAHCGYSVFAHSCWRYCGDNGEWCYIQPTTYCEQDGNCNSNAPCSSPCVTGIKDPAWTSPYTSLPPYPIVFCWLFPLISTCSLCLSSRSSYDYHVHFFLL